MEEEELIKSIEEIDEKMVRNGKLICPACGKEIKGYIRAYSTVPTEWRMSVVNVKVPSMEEKGGKPWVSIDFHGIADGPYEYEFVCNECGRLLTHDYEIAEQMAITMDRLEREAEENA